MQETEYREYLEAFNDEDLETASEYWAEDVSFSIPGDRPDVSGRDELVAFFEDAMARYHEEVELDRFMGDGDGVAVEFTSTYTARRDLPDFHHGPLEEGEELTNRIFVHYDVEDGQFVDVRLAQRDPSPSMAPE